MECNKQFKDLINTLKLINTFKCYECGWSSDYNLKLIASFVEYYRPDLIIHTGILWGKSLAFILEALKNSHRDIEKNPETMRNFDLEFYKFSTSNRRFVKDTKLIAVDNNMFDLNMSAMEELLYDYYSNFVVYKSPSEEFFKTFKPDFEYEFLMGFVDADHTEDGCLKDLVALDKLGAKVLVVDDIKWIPALDIVCDNFSKEYNYKYFKFEFDSGIGLLVK